MKDLENKIGIFVCVALLLGWFLYQSSQPPPKIAKLPNVKEKVTVGNSEEKSNPDINNDIEQDILKKENPAVLKDIIKYPPIPLTNDLVDVILDPNKGYIKSIELYKFKKCLKEQNIIFGGDYNYNALETKVNEDWILTDIKITEKTETKVSTVRTFEYSQNNYCNLTQTWELLDDYKIDYSFSIRNLGNNQLIIPKIGVSTGTMPSLEFLTKRKLESHNNIDSDEYVVEKIDSVAHNIDYFLSKDKVMDDEDLTDDKKSITQDNAVQWINVGNKYFTSLLIFNKNEFENGNTMLRLDKTIVVSNETKTYYILNTIGHTSQIKLEPNESQQFNFTLFAGPKQVELLEKFGNEVVDIMHLGWSIFGWLAYKLLIFLNIIYANVSGLNYGVSIIVLTIIVKMFLWPFTHKANVSMKKMQTLQPKMKEIKEQHKDNPQVMNTKIMQLYKEEKVNPLGGCLPILLQLPVFIALLSTLRNAVELRHVSFLWITDLTKPDTVASILGLDINPLVLVMTLTMLLQQKLTPATGDPMQRKMMMFMPVMMLFFFYNLPAGLTLYWTVSQFVSIIQLLYNQKNDKKELKKA